MCLTSYACFLCIDLIARYGLAAIKESVLKNMPINYMEIGIGLGLKKNNINGLTMSIPTYRGKVEAIIGDVQQNVGIDKMVVMLLRVCDPLDILGGVINDLAQPSHRWCIQLLNGCTVLLYV